jgi:hypothetical protein
MANNVEDLARMIEERFLGRKFDGPVETQYGYGWSPTITYWSGPRRVHFYNKIDDWDRLIVELAEWKATWKPLRAIVPNDDAACRVLQEYLVENRSPESPLQGLEPVSSKGDHDSSIPHPPNRPNPANICEFVAAAAAQGGKPVRVRGCLALIVPFLFR